MTQDVEDSNEFFDDEIKEAKVPHAGTRKIVEIKRGERVLGVARIDHLKAGETYDLPKSQGDNLVRLKLAKKA